MEDIILLLLIGIDNILQLNLDQLIGQSEFVLVKCLFHCLLYYIEYFPDIRVEPTDLGRDVLDDFFLENQLVVLNLLDPCVYYLLYLITRVCFENYPVFTHSALNFEVQLLWHVHRICYTDVHYSTVFAMCPF